MRTLVLGLGNELLADDAVGLLAARALKREFDGHIDVIESSESGLALLDHLVGYDRAIILDAIRTGRCPAGEILEYTVDDLRHVAAPSPHYAGIPELLELARRLGLDFPADLRIIAIEAENLHEIGGQPSVQVTAGVEKAVALASGYLREDIREARHA
jgi:hydrogenase maturation protease